MLEATHELCLADLAVLIQVKFFDHRLSANDGSVSHALQGSETHSQFLVVQILAKLLRYALEVTQRYPACPVIVEQAESASDFVERVSRQYFFRHCKRSSACLLCRRVGRAALTDFSKVLELHLPRTLPVVVAQYLEHFCLLQVET